MTKEQLTLREEDAFQGMYQDRGARFTGDGSIGILQGRASQAAARRSTGPRVTAPQIECSSIGRRCMG